MELGKYGVWQTVAGATPQRAAEAEKLGYGTIWIGANPLGDLSQVEAMLDATERIVVATGIVNMWGVPAEQAAASYHRLEAKHPGRLLLGVGIGHREVTTEFKDPYRTILGYLDALDAAGVPTDRRILAALGPKVLKVAAERTAGAHPYLTTPRHTADARALIGPTALLAPEHKVVLDTDAARARAAGRPTVNFYLGLDNYRRSLKRFGFTDADLVEGGSDALVDALVLHGEVETVVAGLRGHLDAGANHVGIQVLGDPGDSYRVLAEALELA